MYLRTKLPTSGTARGTRSGKVPAEFQTDEKENLNNPYLFYIEHITTQTSTATGAQRLTISLPNFDF
jgi:hypothetical protein